MFFQWEHGKPARCWVFPVFFWGNPEEPCRPEKLTPLAPLGWAAMLAPAGSATPWCVAPARGELGPWIELRDLMDPDLAFWVVEASPFGLPTLLELLVRITFGDI